MSQMAVCLLAPHLGPDSKKLAVLPGYDVFRNHRPGKARPAGARLVLVQRAEQRFAGDDINVDAFPVVVPVFIPESRFCALFLGYLVLQWRKPFFEFMLTPLFAILAPDLIKVTVAARNRSGRIYNAGDFSYNSPGDNPRPGKKSAPVLSA